MLFASTFLALPSLTLCLPVNNINTRSMRYQLHVMRGRHWDPAIIRTRHVFLEWLGYPWCVYEIRRLIRLGFKVVIYGMCRYCNVCMYCKVTTIYFCVICEQVKMAKFYTLKI